MQNPPRAFLLQSCKAKSGLESLHGSGASPVVPHLALHNVRSIVVSFALHTRHQAAEATMETHTLARYIAESTLQDYQFVDVKPSLIAASAMFLALRMRKLGAWVSGRPQQYRL